MGTGLKRAILLATLSLTSAGAASADSATGYVERMQIMPEGEFAHLRHLIGDEFQEACVLYPYQNKLEGDGEFSRDLNAWLLRNKFVGDESHWHLGLDASSKVKLLTFRRGASLDILSAKDFGSTGIDPVPGFTASNCVSATGGGFLKLSFRDRVYYVLGEVK